MKNLFLIIPLLIVSFFQPAQGQDNVKKKIPLMVSHLTAEDKAVLHRKDAPQHHFLGYVICINKKCRGYIGWRNDQRSKRYNGYKNVPKRKPLHPGPERVDTTRRPANVVPVTPRLVVNNPVRPAISRSDTIITLNAVLFDFDSYLLRKEIFPKLDSIVIFLMKMKNMDVKISGHTDNVGKESHNRKLSSNRAEAVAGYFVDSGIDPDRVSFAGYGSDQPVADNNTEEGKRKNRRVEIWIHERK